MEDLAPMLTTLMILYISNKILLYVFGCVLMFISE